jgi:Predicted membrane protein
MDNNTTRITVVDALRGFALVSIMLLHNAEMFEAHAEHVSLPQWMVGLDRVIWDALMFLFGGKSYAIFALLFGLTFYIQSHNQEKAGKDFRWRFVWRLLLLLGFGLINTLFYRGEILVLYALLGVLLIPFKKLDNKTIFKVALVLLMQPIFLTKLVLAFQNPSLEPAIPSFMPFYEESNSFLTSDSMFQLMKSNITNGRIASLLWFWEYGRIEQTLGLFLLGFLAGRKRIFYNTSDNIKFWGKTLVVSAILFIPLFLLESNTGVLSDSKNINAAFSSILRLWSNLAFMLVLVSGFTLLFYTKKTQPILNKLTPIGKMSLTNYILQSIVGAFIFYGFGLGIYRFVGATYSLLIGIALAFAMGIFSKYWMTRHKRGIFEDIWHKLTWIGTEKRNR